ncbi:MAG: hypothetical protein BWY22_00612 [Bacteroidetes bacterium ADurb.Bin217]|nr:MAG: hypothetical protein BWY22_00612 [Bacteroidetes bacterium ADurb.Bin217]
MKAGAIVGQYNVNTEVDSVIFYKPTIAQNDTIYIMKAGAIVGQYNVNTEVDSVIFYKPIIAQNDTEGTFTDFRDGNEYNWVKIGDQVWMAENLKYLPSVVRPSTGSNTTAYYYVYGYDGTNVTDAKATANYATYGVLYNWTAVMNGAASTTANPSTIQGVCPTGWHLPSNAEWTELIDYLGGQSVACGKLKETGTTHWESSNAEATNETGFTALPGGNRNVDGLFDDIGSYGYWWSATEFDVSFAWSRDMYSYTSYVHILNSKKDLGFSVRCVRD